MLRVITAQAAVNNSRDITDRKDLIITIAADTIITVNRAVISKIVSKADTTVADITTIVSREIITVRADINKTDLSKAGLTEIIIITTDVLSRADLIAAGLITDVQCRKKLQNNYL